MSKAKLSQIKNSWIDEDETKKQGRPKAVKTQEIGGDEPRKQQTFTLKVEAIKRLWMHRAITGKTISETLDDLVIKHIPKHS